MKRLIILMLTAAFFLTSCALWNPEPPQGPAEEETSGPAPEKSSPQSGEISVTVSELSETVKGGEYGDFVYLAFGDSIAAGYGLENPEQDCYGGLFASRFSGVRFENFAVSGHQTADLLDLLTEKATFDADLVTLSIGANNLLGHAVNALGEVMERYGYGIFQEYAAALIRGEKSENVGNFIRDIKEALTGSAFNEKAEAGLSTLKADLPLIFQRIKEQNQKENAIYVIQTIYNPYEGFVLGLPGGEIFDLSAECDVYLARYNEAIAAVADEYDILVMEVYEAFHHSKTDLINAGIASFPEISFSIDPHPNALGHVQIADLLYHIWIENHKS